jgi:DNA-binding beta-propeller fold protein YncE
VAVLAALAARDAHVSRIAAQGRGSVQLPAFQVDPLWPRPLPNHWILGSITGVAVDSQDHIWIVHRGLDSLNLVTEAGLATNPPSGETCCAPAPPVLEFDPAGNLVGHWGGPGQGYDWPQSPGGLAVDSKGNVWIAAAGPPEAAIAAPGRGGTDVGLTEAGAEAVGLPLVVGDRPGAPRRRRPGRGRPHPAVHAYGTVPPADRPRRLQEQRSATGLNRPAGVAIEDASGEIYVADGFGNHRVVVFTAATGAYTRHSGAYGAKPDDGNLGSYDPGAPPAKQFRTVSCVEMAKDGTVYVCDRRNDRIQAFRKDGTFLKEVSISSATRGNGSVWDIALSSDPQQRYVYVADGQDEQIVVLQRHARRARQFRRRWTPARSVLRRRQSGRGFEGQSVRAKCAKANVCRSSSRNDSPAHRFDPARRSVALGLTERALEPRGRPVADRASPAI